MINIALACNVTLVMVCNFLKLMFVVSLFNIVIYTHILPFGHRLSLYVLP